MIDDPIAAAKITAGVYASVGERCEAMLTPLVNTVAAELAESPEAWRGAATICSLLVDILGHDQSSPDRHATLALAVCMLTASHPAAVAAVRRKQ